MSSYWQYPRVLTLCSYERYLSVDDEEVFTHLSSLNPAFQNYNMLAQRLVLSQLSG